MERHKPSRSDDIALHLDERVSAPAPDIFNAPVATAPDEGVAHVSVSSDEQLETSPDTPPQALKPSVLEGELRSKVRTVFDQHLRRLERIKAGLRPAPDRPDAPETDTNDPPRWSPERRRPQAPPSYLLPETLVYFHRLAHPPLLPAPRIATFEAAFRRHEPMFHTVFYRKYPPWVLDDAKQEGLLALFRKWLKNKSILDQTSANVTTAAIYGVSNWRQKGMKVRANEGALMVDAHGKVAGEPHAHSHERWTDRIDRKLDVTQAVEVVLYQYEEAPDYRAIYRVVQDVRDDIPFKQGQQASGLALRDYRRRRDDVKARLRIQLAEYAPQPERAARGLGNPTDRESDREL